MELLSPQVLSVDLRPCVPAGQQFIPFLHNTLGQSEPASLEVSRRLPMTDGCWGKGPAFLPPGGHESCLDLCLASAVCDVSHECAMCLPQPPCRRPLGEPSAVSPGSLTQHDAHSVFLVRQARGQACHPSAHSWLQSKNPMACYLPRGEDSKILLS